MIVKSPDYTRLSDYPSLTATEFAEACKELEGKSHDNLAGTNWITVQWKQGELCIKQTSAIANDTGNSVVINKNSDEQQSNASNLEDDEEDDMDAMARHWPTSNQSRPAVDFSIVLSPTYRVPVLWFTLSSNKVARIQDLEEIYSHVVAPGSHKSLRGIGIMGGISLANHPITGRPEFFIHPCNTPEALAALNDGSELSPFQYLLLWFGVVGAGVGLHVPSRVAS